MDNLEFYNSLRSVPDEAKKEIKGGRLAGKTDINPMWRIKAMTERFGPCGIGWKYEVVEKTMAPGADGEVAAFVDINLYIKVSDEWSAPIPGTGGSAFVAKEKNGLYTSDECYKMALTDAISVACKALGVAADVYWDKDHTKYGNPVQLDKPGNRAPSPEDEPVYCEKCGARFADYWDGEQLIKAASMADRQRQRFGGRTLCAKCGKKAMQASDST